MNFRWIALMAWRDGRHSWRRLMLYMSAIVMGVGALVAVRSLGENLMRVVDEQAKVLLGADLSIRSRSPFSAEALELVREIGGEQATQTSFATMALFPRQGGTRLVQVRGVSGPFPFYGVLKTEPPGAGDTYRAGPYALVDETLMLQFDVRVGDIVKLGDVLFTIQGRLIEIPGESAIASDLAPRIFIPGDYVEQTGLIQVGSRVSYRVFCRFADGFDVESLVEANKETFDKLDLSVDTVEERKQDFRRELRNMTRFLGLVGFIALVLGGVGVASSIHLYVRQRIEVIAVLRCIGASPFQGLAIYVLQAGLMGLAGAVAGIGVGLLAQFLIPLLFSDLLPFELEQTVSLTAITEGLFTGLATALLFSLIPLAPIRLISPLRTLRSDFESERGLAKDRLSVLLAVVALLCLAAFSLWYSPNWGVGLGFFGGILVVFGLLFGVARLIMHLTRRYFPSSWHYEWRQGLANLYRPHNQTVVLMLAVGLGTFFIVTLYFSQSGLLAEVARAGGGDRPNLVMFDIQSDQKEAIRSMLEGSNLPILQDVPIVTMRMKAVNRQSVESLLDRPERRRGRWALRREYRSTYRDHLTDAEKLVAGSFQGSVQGDEVLVTVEEGIARELDLALGDALTFDIQGVPLDVRISGLRNVEWRNFEPNFFVLFPTGVLEEAPQFHVLVTRTPDAEASALFQRDLISRFPNVSAIDLSLVIQTVDSILDRLTFVIQFMALFSIATGLLVMVSAIVSGRFQRMRESILLRTLGASRAQIHRILLIEYFFLGLFSAVTGLSLAFVAGWALSLFVFEIPFVPDSVVVAVALLTVVGLTIIIGLTNSRGILSQPPLQVLRGED